jgi:hypothetical protein
LGGWVKLHRSLLDSATFADANLLKVFIWALLRANHKTTKIPLGGEEIPLKPGQFVSGRFAGARECNMNPSTFWSQIQRLRRMRNLYTASDSKRTVFTDQPPRK